MPRRLVWTLAAWEDYQFWQQQDRKTLKETALEAECILIATGRQPNTAGLGLEAAGVTAGGKGIAVDDNMLTNVPQMSGR